MRTPLRTLLVLALLAAPRRGHATVGDRTAAVPAPGGYARYDEVIATLSRIAGDHPESSRLVDVTTALAAPPTAEGRHLYALKISGAPERDADAPAVLLVAGVHAREIGGPVVALAVARKLADAYGVDPDLTSLVDDHEIWIAPVWNPDGYEHALTVDGSWRKNRRRDGGFTGVDLNRNYPFGWDAACGGSLNGNDETFRGPAAASEAETTTMLSFARDRHFAKVLDVHSPGRQVVFGMSCWSYPLLEYVADRAGALSRAAGFGGARRTASATGEHAQFQLATFGSLAFTIEIGLVDQPPRDVADAEAERVWPGVLWWLREPAPVWGHVVDACTGRPVAARVRYGGVPFEHDESSASGGPHGRWHAFVPPGTYRFSFAAPGYEDGAADVTLRADRTVEVTARLAPLAGCSPLVTDGGSGPTDAGADASGSTSAPAPSGCSVGRSPGGAQHRRIGAIGMGLLAAWRVRRRPRKHQRP